MVGRSTTQNRELMAAYDIDNYMAKSKATFLFIAKNKLSTVSSNSPYVNIECCNNMSEH